MIAFIFLFVGLLSTDFLLGIIFLNLLNSTKILI